MRLEGIFGGALALFVVLVAIYALSRGDRPEPIDPTPTIPTDPARPGVEPNPLCQCYDDGFDLAGSDVGVMSSQYRAGFEQCRARLGDEGGDAWTAGWNARLSSQPWLSSCEGWLADR